MERGKAVLSTQSKRKDKTLGMYGNAMVQSTRQDRILGMYNHAMVRAPQRGAMMVLVMVALMMLGGIMAASLHIFKTTERVVDFELHYHGQAVNTAKAGLIDALSWFRRQTAQPVEDFDPQRDLAVMPPINETDDPDIGLVREYEISTRDNIWERYEVRKRAVQDLTQERNLSGQGRYWYIEAKGYIFQRLDPNYTPDKFYLVYDLQDGEQKVKQPDGTYLVVNNAPNGILEERFDSDVVRVLASTKMATELRRLSVIPPANAALCASRGDLVSLGNRSRVMGGNSHGLIYPSGTGTHWKDSGGELSGSPAYGTADPATYLMAMGDVFGVSRQELRMLSDIYTDDPATLPDELPDYSLVYIDSDVAWDAVKPLRGTAIVYVDGNVTIAANSSSYFTGILYVEGNYTQFAPSLMNGTMMVQGSLSISGLGDYSEAGYDPAARQRILTISGQYRFSAPMYFVE
jgi:hypothetical protein